MRYVLQIILVILSCYTIISCGRDTQVLPSNQKEDETKIVDTDTDGILDSADNCPTVANPDQMDKDGDKIGDVCDSSNGNVVDTDGDGVVDSADNCKDKANTDQIDTDKDGKGDACDDTPNGLPNDKDSDTIEDSKDNCPEKPNTDQTDTDKDGKGDVCDDTPNGLPNDKDGDTIEDSKDNCIDKPNVGQIDTDNDGKGDACDEVPGASPNDKDSDTIDDSKDNCPDKANTDQADADKDGKGDACDDPVNTNNQLPSNALTPPSILKNATVLVKSLQGLTAIGLGTDGKAYHSAILEENKKVGDWTYSEDDKIVAFGRFISKDKDSILIRKDGSAIFAILELDKNKWTYIDVTPPEDEVMKIWGLNVQLDGAMYSKGDFDGDKKDELIAIDKENGILVIFKIENKQLMVKKTYKDLNNGSDQFGAWNFGVKDTIVAVGDYDGYGGDDFIIKSGWGMGIIKMEDKYSLTSIATSENTKKIRLSPSNSEWQLTANDTIIPLGDFYGVNKEAFILNPQTFGIYSFTLFNVNKSKIIEGSSITLTDGQVLNTGDYNGDGNVDILYKISSEKLSILSSYSKFNVFTPNESMLNNWKLNLDTDTFDVSGDFDGNDKDEFIIKSSWGFGIMGVDNSNKFTLVYANEYNKTEIDGLSGDTSKLKLKIKDDFLGVGKFMAE